jgi:hypothetical protein
MTQQFRSLETHPMAAPDTSMYPPLPGTAERPGYDEREHPAAAGMSGAGADSVLTYLREVQWVIIEANLRDIKGGEPREQR